MDYMHVAVLLVVLTQIIMVGAYAYLSHRLHLTHKEMDAMYRVVTLLVNRTKEQDLKLALLLTMQDVEIEGFEILTSGEEAIARIFESLGESAEGLSPEDFN